MSEEKKVVATNRRATHDYFIDDTFEVGIVLVGSEIKSVRAGRVNLRDSYAQIKDDELWLVNTHIAPYDPASRENHEPRRTRKLLAHKREIARMLGKILEKGYTLVPLKLYLKNNRAKVELGLARGKKQYDKRQSIAEREAQREVERTVKARAYSQTRD